MSAHYEYKGYLGSAEVDVESEVLHGKLLFLRDTITYSADKVSELESAFREAVDDYLTTCAEEGDEPDVPCKGSFNVRVGADLHRKVAITARRLKVGLNEFVCSALSAAVTSSRPRTVYHQHEVNVTFTGEQQVVGSTSTPSVWKISDVSAKH